LRVIIALLSPPPEAVAQLDRSALIATTTKE
jgi:hypothetical protein